MKTTRSFAARIAGAGSLALLLSAPIFAAPQDHSRETRAEFRADRLSTQGRISAVSHEGERFRVTLDHGNYSYWVPAGTVGTRNLRIGASVRLGGIIAGDDVNVDLLAMPGEPYYEADPNYRAVPMGSTGWMTGVVQRVDRHLGYLTIRDEASGETVKVDVRHMNLRKPVNVWGINAGERISVNGSWERKGTFDADRIEY
jgi:hypothetical protein